MDYLSLASDLIGVAGALFAALAWGQSRRVRRELAAERARLEEPVQVVLALASNGQRRELPIALRRAELTRAELLGRLGMLPMRESGKRFSLAYLATSAFLGDLADAQAASGVYTLTIPCTDTEYQQFA